MAQTRETITTTTTKIEIMGVTTTETIQTETEITPATTTGIRKTTTGLGAIIKEIIHQTGATRIQDGQEMPIVITIPATIAQTKTGAMATTIKTEMISNKRIDHFQYKQPHTRETNKGSDIQAR